MGIDYGMGLTNIDKATGIRYGVISQNECLQAWADGSEADYGEPHCPRCGNEAVGIDDERVPEPDDEASDGWKYEGNDHACLSCQITFDSDEAYGDEPLGYTLDDGEYKAEAGSDGDIFILESPYYTLCDFCSPCAPGAGYLTSPGSVKAYCFGHDWFYDHPEHPKVAPYTVYRVSDDSIVEPE